MDILYAFAHVGHLVDNTPDVVGPIGELSSYSMTFARDRLIYTDLNHPNVNLVVFQNRDLEGNDKVLPLQDRTDILRISEWIISQGRGGNFDESVSDFQTAFITHFGDEFEIIESGPMVMFGQNRYCPESINVTRVGHTADYLWTLWLSDDAFRNQCPISHIEIVPPVDDIDLLLEDVTTVSGIVNPPNMMWMNNQARELQDSKPYTDLRTWRFDWMDPDSFNSALSTHWLTLHWGDAGNNIDSVKNAIKEYILAHTARDPDDWATVFPEIFTSTEFMIIPHYDLVALPSKFRQSGIYSPTTNHAKCLADAVEHIRGPGYDPVHIEDVLETTPTLYRSIAVSIIGGPDNREGINRFTLRYPDYMNIATTHVDFGYMTEETREFVMLLNEMLLLADTATASSTIPRKFNRITREGQVYIATSFKDFLYLIVPKYAYNK